MPCLMVGGGGIKQNFNLPVCLSHTPSSKTVHLWLWLLQTAKPEEHYGVELAISIVSRLVHGWFGIFLFC